MTEIPLTKKYVAIIDLEDFERVSQYKWYAAKWKGNVYAKANIRNNDGVKKPVRMHRFLLGVTDPNIKVDHRDRNSLNNQKSNLRICTQAENTRNRGMDRRNVTGYKGPVWDKTNNRWSVCITFNYKTIRIGRYDTLEEAARAYNVKAKELFGEFAVLNDVPDGPVRESGVLDRHNTTGFRGIYRKRNVWLSSIQHKNKQIGLGVFKTKEAAARAYDAKAIELFGPGYPKLNFPLETQQPTT